MIKKNRKPLQPASESNPTAKDSRTHVYAQFTFDRVEQRESEHPLTDGSGFRKYDPHDFPKEGYMDKLCCVAISTKRYWYNLYLQLQEKRSLPHSAKETGTITLTNVIPEEILNITGHQWREEINPLTRTHWWKYLVYKCNPNDDDLHSDFNYEDLRKTQCSFGSKFPVVEFTGHVNILIQTNIERLLSTVNYTAIEHNQTFAKLIEGDCKTQNITGGNR